MKIRYAGLACLIGAMAAQFAGASELHGAGSVIPTALYSTWAGAYAVRNPATVIKYQGISPAEGIKRIEGNAVDFAGIDMPVPAAELKQQGLVQFPMALSAVAPIVNLQGVYPGQLRLDGETFGDILLGKIRRWNDPALVALNPQLSLPDAAIVVLHRSAPPGVRAIVGDYLAKVNPDWRARMGEGMSGNWPAGSIEVKDPREMIASIQSIPNAVGYLEVSHIMANKLVYAQLRNKEGHFVSPGDENIGAAAEGINWNPGSSFDETLTDQPGAASWPICIASMVLMHKVSAQPERTREMLDFFSFGLRLGQLSAIQNGYVPLPTSVAISVRSSWKTSFVGAGGQTVWNR